MTTADISKSRIETESKSMDQSNLGWFYIPKLFRIFVERTFLSNVIFLMTCFNMLMSLTSEEIVFVFAVYASAVICIIIFLTELAMDDPMMGGDDFGAGDGFGAGEGLDFLDGFEMEAGAEIAGLEDIDKSLDITLTKPVEETETTDKDEVENIPNDLQETDAVVPEQPTG